MSRLKGYYYLVASPKYRNSKLISSFEYYNSADYGENSSHFYPQTCTFKTNVWKFSACRSNIVLTSHHKFSVQREELLKGLFSPSDATDLRPAASSQPNPQQRCSYYKTTRVNQFTALLQPSLCVKQTPGNTGGVTISLWRHKTCSNKGHQKMQKIKRSGWWTSSLTARCEFAAPMVTVRAGSSQPLNLCTNCWLHVRTGLLGSIRWLHKAMDFYREINSNYSVVKHSSSDNFFTWSYKLTNLSKCLSHFVWSTSKW